MGRSRRHHRAASATRPPVAAGPDARERRRTLAAYLAGALVLAVAVMLGTVLLAGTLAPWAVLAAVAGGAVALHRWAHGRLAGAALGDEDRVLQTMAGGLLVLAVGFGLVAAVLLSFA